MQRLQRVALLWNWLPAFRAVAEVGGIRKAAALIGTSPSAMSRSITLLEAEVGVPLFDRVGAKLSLTRAGEELLTRVRAAMRGVDEALPAVAERRPMLLLATNARWLEDVTARVALEVAARHADATVETALVGTEQAVEALLSGRADLLLFTKPTAHEEVEEVGKLSVPLVIAGAPNHPLAGTSIEAMEVMLARSTFIVPPPDVDLDADDGWALPAPRTIRLAVPSLTTALDACARGLGYVVAPASELARRAPNAIVALPTTIAPRTLYLYRRKPAGPTPLIDLAASLLTEAFVAPPAPPAR